MTWQSSLTRVWVSVGIVPKGLLPWRVMRPILLVAPAVWRRSRAIAATSNSTETATRVYSWAAIDVRKAARIATSRTMVATLWLWIVLTVCSLLKATLIVHPLVEPHTWLATIAIIILTVTPVA